MIARESFRFPGRGSLGEGVSLATAAHHRASVSGEHRLPACSSWQLATKPTTYSVWDGWDLVQEYFDPGKSGSRDSDGDGGVSIRCHWTGEESDDKQLLLSGREREHVAPSQQRRCAPGILSVRPARHADLLQRSEPTDRRKQSGSAPSLHRPATRRQPDPLQNVVKAGEKM